MQTYLVVWHAPLQGEEQVLSEAKVLQDEMREQIWGISAFRRGVCHCRAEHWFWAAVFVLYFLLELASVTPLRSFLVTQIGPDLP